MAARCFFKGFLLIFLLVLVPQAKAEKVLRIGVLAWSGSPDWLQSWQPAQQLEAALPEYRIEWQGLNFTALEGAVRDQTVDLVLTNPGHYVHLAVDYPLAPLVSLQNSELSPSQQAIGSAVVALQERKELKNWSDLSGQRLGIVSRKAFGGFQLVQEAWLQAGFGGSSELATLVELGFPMEALLSALHQEQVDAVVLRACLLETLAAEGQAQLSDYRILGQRQTAGYPCLHSTELYPDWPLLRLDSTDPELARLVVQRLLSHQQADGYQWAVPLSYQPVHELFERLRVGPYASFPHNPLLHFIQAHRHWLGLAAGLLAALLLHTVRAAYLLRRRTLELREIELQTRQRQQELNLLSRQALMGELASGLAHELNQPLTSIINYARGSERLLQAEIRPDQQQALSLAMTRMTRQAEQAAGIIKNLRSFLQQEEVARQQLDIARVLEEVLSLMQASLHQQSIKVSFLCLGKGWVCEANPVQLTQILINLLSNAIEAMQELPLNQRRVDIRCYQQAPWLIIEVADQGPGLSAETQQKVFTPFFTTKAQGMGLGLSLSRRLAEAQGGHLQLENRSEGGALAQVYLLQA